MYEMQAVSIKIINRPTFFLSKNGQKNTVFFLTGRTCRTGRPTRRWEQDINEWMDMTTTQAGRLAEDRILFRQKVQEATSRQEIS